MIVMYCSFTISPILWDSVKRWILSRIVTFHYLYFLWYFSPTFWGLFESSPPRSFFFPWERANTKNFCCDVVIFNHKNAKLSFQKIFCLNFASKKGLPHITWPASQPASHHLPASSPGQNAGPPSPGSAQMSWMATQSSWVQLKDCGSKFFFSKSGSRE